MTKYGQKLPNCPSADEKALCRDSKNVEPSKGRFDPRLVPQSLQFRSRNQSPLYVQISEKSSAFRTAPASGWIGQGAL
ncbi:MAG: hypothetical protein AAGH90_05020, partial [Pseudomonadota bacterium]